MTFSHPQSWVRFVGTVRFERGDGIRISDTKGNTFFDAVSALWCSNLGFSPNWLSLLEQGLSVADADARREIMAKMEKIMQDEGVLIQSYWRPVFNHSNGQFANVELHPFYQLDLHDIYLKA